MLPGAVVVGRADLDLDADEAPVGLHDQGADSVAEVEEDVVRAHLACVVMAVRMPVVVAQIVVVGVAVAVARA